MAFVSYKPLPTAELYNWWRKCFSLCSFKCKYLPESARTTRKGMNMLLSQTQSKKTKKLVKEFLREQKVWAGFKPCVIFCQLMTPRMVIVSIPQTLGMGNTIMLWLNCPLYLLCFANCDLYLVLLYSLFWVPLINQKSFSTSDIFRISKTDIKYYILHNLKGPSASVLYSWHI